MKIKLPKKEKIKKRLLGEEEEDLDKELKPIFYERESE